MIEEYITAIQTIGFPIVVTLYFMIKMEKVIDTNTKAVNNNSSIIQHYFNK